MISLSYDHPYLYLNHIEETLISPFAREFKYVYDDCKNNKNNKNILKKAAKKFYLESSGYTAHTTEESQMVGMLTGVRPNARLTLQDFSKEPILYGDCNGLGHYKHYHDIVHGLYTKSLKNYLLATDLKSSCVSFRANKKYGSDNTLTAIQLVWYSKEDIPQGIELYGLKKGIKKQKNISHKKLIGLFHPEIEISAGYAASTLHLPYELNQSERSYDEYQVHWLGGKHHQQMRLRALIPIFGDLLKPLEGEKNMLLKLAYTVSEMAPYGPGVSRLPQGLSCDIDHIAKYLAHADSLHCGNYALIFAHRLPKTYRWTITPIASLDHRHHALVEVHTPNNQDVTVDPTSGRLYPCRISQLIDGTCAYDRVLKSKLVHPIFELYSGINFFYGAKVLSRHQGFDDVASAYCRST